MTSTRRPRHPAPAPRRPWRPARRHVAYAAGGAAALVAATAVACADAGPTASVPPGEVPPPAAGPAAAALTPARVAWVGQAHNAGVRRLVRRAMAGRRPDARHPSREAVCRGMGALARAYLAERPTADLLRERVGAAAADGVGALADGTEACTVGESVDLGARTAALLAALRTNPPERPAAARALRANASGADVWSLAGEALTVVSDLDVQITAAPNAAALSVQIAALEARAQALGDERDRAIVLGALATARASAYNVEDPCTWGNCGGAEGGGGGGGGGELPIYMTGAPGTPGSGGSVTHDEEHINKRVIKADVWGCIAVGIRGAFLAGPQGALSGCFVGGISASGGVIFNYIF